MKTMIRTTLAALAAFTTLTAPAPARPGDLDKSFDADGRQTVLFGGSEFAYAVAQEILDGKVLIGGITDAGGPNDFALTRLNPDGSLDTAFGSSGRVYTDFSGGNDYAYGVGVRQTGFNVNDPILVIAAGGSDNGLDDDFALARYDYFTGAPVAAFGGGDGKVTNDLGANENFECMIFQADNKIVGGGGTDAGGNYNIALLRYLIDGSLDTSFGVLGVVITDFFAGTDFCYDLAQQADGKILAGCGATVAGKESFAVVRYNTNGSVDGTFSGGKVTVNFPGLPSARCNAIRVQSDGKIVAAGSVGPGTALALARFKPDGTLDTAFGSGGTVVTGTGAAELPGSPTMILQRDGKILVTGNNFKVIRFKKNGALDKGFGKGGSVTVTFGTSSYSTFADGMTIRPDGTIVAVGGVSPTFNTGDFAIASLKTAQGDARVGVRATVPRGDDIYNTTGAGQAQGAILRHGGGTKTIFTGIQNDTAASDSFKVKGTPGNGEFKVKYLHGATNVTAKVLAGTLNTGPLSPGAIYQLKARITATTPLAGRTRNFSVIPTSAKDPTAKDRVIIKAKSN